LFKLKITPLTQTRKEKTPAIARIFRILLEIKDEKGFTGFIILE
jgi:hypothetical protein